MGKRGESGENIEKHEKRGESGENMESREHMEKHGKTGRIKGKT